MEKFNDILSKRHFILLRDILKYGFVSVFALVVDVSLLYLLVEYIHMYYIFAATVAFCFGLITNYTLGKMFVFRNSKLAPLHEFIWYASIGIIGLILNDLIIYLLVWMQVWYLYAKAVSVAVVFFFNFFGRRRLFADQ